MGNGGQVSARHQAGLVSTVALGQLMGNLTVRSNLAAACLTCNRRKGHREVFSWWREQPYWSELGQARLIDWITHASRSCG
jgi:hypothetical protein